MKPRGTIGRKETTIDASSQLSVVEDIRRRIQEQRMSQPLSQS